MRLIGDDIRQQSQMAGAFDFARQFALAARAIAGLAPRLNLAALVDITGEHVDVFIIEAAALGAISGSATATPSASSAGRSAAPPSAALRPGAG